MTAVFLTRQKISIRRTMVLAMPCVATSGSGARRIVQLAVAIGLVLSGITMPLQAQVTRTWMPQAFSTDWHDPANWSPVGVPNGLDDVVHDNGLRAISLFNGPTASIDNFLLTGGARMFADENALTINAAGDSGLMQIIGSGSELIVRDGAAASDVYADSLNVEVGGNLKLEGGTVRIDREVFVDSGSRITGHGIVEFGDQELGNPPTVMTLNGAIRPAGGEIRIQTEVEAEVLLENSHLDAGYGDLSIDATLSYQYGGTITIGAGKSISFERGAQFDTTATLNMFGGDSNLPAVFNSPLASRLASKVNVNGSGVFAGRVGLTRSADVRLPNPDDVLKFNDAAYVSGNNLDPVEPGATFTGQGQVINETAAGMLLFDQPVFDVEFVNSGFLEAGIIAFVIYVETGGVEFESFRQTESGIMNYDIGQIGETILSDYFIARDTAELDGALEVNLVEISNNPFPTLEAGQSYEIISAAGGVFGEFSSTVFPTPPAGTAWRLIYEPTSVVLELVSAEEAIPNSMNVISGDLVSGSADELACSDNSDLVIKRRSGGVQSRTQFEVTGTSPFANPSYILVTLEGSVFARSTVTQSIELYNYDTLTWERFYSQDASRLVDSVVEFEIRDAPERFVDSVSNEMKARVLYRSANPRQQFSSNTDQFIWTLGN